jgi:hypothetical protein
VKDFNCDVNYESRGGELSFRLRRIIKSRVQIVILESPGFVSLTEMSYMKVQGPFGH